MICYRSFWDESLRRIEFDFHASRTSSRVVRLCVTRESEIRDLWGHTTLDLKGNTVFQPAALCECAQSGDWLVVDFVEPNDELARSLLYLLDLMNAGENSFLVPNADTTIHMHNKFRLSVIAVSSDQLEALFSPHLLARLPVLVLGEVDDKYLQHYQARLAESMGIKAITLPDLGTPHSPNFPLHLLYHLRANAPPFFHKHVLTRKITDVLHLLRAYLDGTEVGGIFAALPFIESLFPSSIIETDKEYLLQTNSSRVHKAQVSRYFNILLLFTNMLTQAVAMCLCANIAVLMEGAAATGKTALARYLCNHSRNSLEIVSNSASTTIEGSQNTNNYWVKKTN